MALFRRKSVIKPPRSLKSCGTSKPSQQPPMIAVASGKGGVGKSTLTRNLAATMVAKGLRVGIIDADIYGPSQCNLLDQASAKCQIDEQGWIVPLEHDGVSVVSVSALMSDESAVIWRAPMATRLVGDFLTRVKWPDLDYILVDLPPGTGDIQITLAQQARLAGAIVVTTPQSIAYKVAEKAIGMFDKVHVPLLGIVENMSGFVCTHCGETSKLYPSGGGALLAENHQSKLLAKIPLDETLLELAETGQSITQAADDNKAKLAYAELAAQVPARLADAVNPDEPTKVDVNDGRQLTLAWADGEQATFHPYQLRLACACATCVDETTGQPLLDKSTIPGDIKIKSINPVGRYGYKIAFSDGHGTGIYTFDVLRAMAKQDFVAPPADAPTSAEPVSGGTSDVPTLEQVRHVVDSVLNPQVAQHGGRIVIHEVLGNTVRLEMTGGCQGCSQSSVTLDRAVKTLLQQHFPSLTEFEDMTRHSEGKNPFYASEKVS